MVKNKAYIHMVYVKPHYEVSDNFDSCVLASSNRRLLFRSKHAEKLLGNFNLHKISVLKF